MDNSNYSIDCKIHGKNEEAFVCQHLVEGEDLGFNIGYDANDPYTLNPDAWCNQCESVWQEEGEWNERSEAFAGIKIICSQCYQGVRERNWIENESITNSLIEAGKEYLADKQEKFLKKYRINDHERWDWHKSEQKLVFSNTAVRLRN